MSGEWWESVWSVGRLSGVWGESVWSVGGACSGSAWRVDQELPSLGNMRYHVIAVARIKAYLFLFFIILLNLHSKHYVGSSGCVYSYSLLKRNCGGSPMCAYSQSTCQYTVVL